MCGAKKRDIYVCETGAAKEIRIRKRHSVDDTVSLIFI